MTVKKNNKVRPSSPESLVHVLRSLLLMDRWQKQAFIIGVDTICCFIASSIAFSLRIGEWNFLSWAILEFSLVAMLFWPVIFFRIGVYKTVARFIGLRTLGNIARACAIYTCPMVFIFMIYGVPGVPRTIAIIQPITFFLMVTFSRILARYFLVDVVGQHDFAGYQREVFIYGAGAAGQQLALSTRHEPSVFLHGFIDDDRRLRGQQLDGIPIHHSDDIGELIERSGATDILLALPNISRARRSEIIDKIQEFPVRVQTLPNLQQLVEGKVSINDLQEIEIEDLLGRDPVAPNELLMSRTIAGKTVVVTGAGGSIGSELCRQILRIRPHTLILIEITEHALYLIEKDLLRIQSDEGYPETKIVPILANVVDVSLVTAIFTRWQPDTVFHAAAYKHVPLVEINVLQGIKNNVFSTLHCARAALNTGVENFILISTDKAVRPTNVMGASKRVCELILQALAEEKPLTKFAMVRFGNVLGSSGSVVPLFKEQIRGGGPVTLTHRDITRYFMTIPEAAQLVIQAGGMATGGEVYVLDMGKPVRIADLAETMIHLSGLTVRDDSNSDGDIEIIETGLRPGEKLYEELLIGDDMRSTTHKRIMQAREWHMPLADLTPVLDELALRIAAENELAVLELLAILVPEYQSMKNTALQQSA